MLATTLSLALTASLALASPLSRRDPVLRQASGFSLAARVTGTPGPAFDVPVDNWRVIGGRLAPGRNAAILNADAAATFFVNGTAAEVADRLATVALPPFFVEGTGAVPVYVFPFPNTLGIPHCPFFFSLPRDASFASSSSCFLFPSFQAEQAGSGDMPNQGKRLTRE